MELVIRGFAFCSASSRSEAVTGDPDRVSRRISARIRTDSSFHPRRQTTTSRSGDATKHGQRKWRRAAGNTNDNLILHYVSVTEGVSRLPVAPCWFTPTLPLGHGDRLRTFFTRWVKMNHYSVMNFFSFRWNWVFEEFHSQIRYCKFLPPWAGYKSFVKLDLMNLFEHL